MKTTQPKKIRRNFFLRLRPILRWVIKLRSSPKAIAGGLGLGTFIAFTPTMGVQLILAVVVATFLNLNRPAAMIPVWIKIASLKQQEHSNQAYKQEITKTKATSTTQTTRNPQSNLGK